MRCGILLAFIDALGQNDSRDTGYKIILPGHDNRIKLQALLHSPSRREHSYVQRDAAKISASGQITYPPSFPNSSM